MEWTESLKRSINYMEQHLLEEISVDDVAEVVHMSPFYFQKGFSIMTGYTVGEYIRCRRLYLAALELADGREKVIDLAYKYGYDTPESFTKAFGRFHGISPAQMKGNVKRIKVFLPLKISVSIKGGNEMDYTVESMEAMKVVGVAKEISYETAYGEIPSMWAEFMKEYCNGKCHKDVEKYMVGEFGICLDDAADKKFFRYMIAGRFTGGAVPEGMELYEIPAMDWAKFRCTGPLPGALQSVNTQIYKEWLPGNGEYEVAAGISVEWYSSGDGSASDYESAIWIPVKKK